jgi:hypothetical protein
MCPSLLSVKDSGTLSSLRVPADLERGQVSDVGAKLPQAAVGGRQLAEQRQRAGLEELGGEGVRAVAGEVDARQARGAARQVGGQLS